MREEWGGRLIRGWDERWYDLPLTLGDEIGRVCLGAAPGQTFVGDSTTVLLYKLIRAGVDAAGGGRDEIVVDTDNFPTDRYVVEGIAAERGLTVRWVEVDRALGVTADLLAPVLGERTALVVLSHVAYRSAYRADGAALTRPRARGRRADPVGPVALRRLGAAGARRRGAPTSRSAARTSTSTAGRARRPSATSPAGIRRRCASRCRAGWATPTRS